MYIFCLKTSHAMGMGHFFRMLNLRQALVSSGASILFVLLGEHEPAQHWLETEGIDYEVADETLSGWESWLIKRYQPLVWVNDRLNTEAGHVAALQAEHIKVVTFDDCGSGALLADLHVSALGLARGEQPAGKIVLHGLDYLILPQELMRYRRQRHSDGKLVVCLGGSDTYGMTIKVAAWLAEQRRAATLVLGPGFMHEMALLKVMTDMMTIKRAPESLMEEFYQHDLAITGGGLTAFEAAAAGLPTLTIANEQHEIGHCRYLQDMGCSVYLGYRDEADMTRLDKSLDVEAMSHAGLALMTLHGSENICRELLLISKSRIEEKQ